MPNDPSNKSRGVATILAVALGLFGAHRFYVRKPQSGIVMALTLGGLGIWWLYDLVMVVSGKFSDVDGRRLVRWDLADYVLIAIGAGSMGTVMATNAYPANGIRVLLIGAGTLAALGVLLGAVSSPEAKVRTLLFTAGLAALLTAVMSAAEASSAGTPSCPGPQDCDNGYAVGAGLITVALAPVYFILIYIGRLARYFTRRAQAHELT